jgi:hypothetical protein
MNEKYYLQGENEIKKQTVRSRLKDGRKILVGNLGPTPCLLALEPFFVETF